MKIAPVKKLFWLRLFISFMVIVTLYMAIIVLPRIKAEKRDEPRRRLAIIKTILEENRLLLGSFGLSDTKSVSAAESLDALYSKLNDNQGKLHEFSVQNAALLDQETSQMIKDYLGLEKQLIDQYQARHSALAKIVIYSPADDLKTTDPAELLAHANDTAHALKKFSEKRDFTIAIENIDYTFQLPVETQNKIKASADCFQEYVGLLAVGNAHSIEKKLDCIDEYSETRESTVSAIISVFSSELSEKINQAGSGIIAKLDSAPIK